MQLFIIRNSLFRKSFSGFTLMELLLSIAVMTMLAGIAGTSYINSYRQAVLKNTVEELVFEVRFAQQKAISQEQANAWGIRFDNTDISRPFADVFVATYTSANIVHHYPLPPAISFLQPAAGTVQDINFAKLTGVPGASSTISLGLRNSSFLRTITVTAAGGVSAD